MSNYKKKVLALAAAAVMAAGVFGVTASTVDDGAKANSVKVQKRANSV